MKADNEQEIDSDKKTSGHGQKISRKMESLIANLLGTSTYAQAAKATGISEPTLYRWLRLPEFQNAFKNARRRIVDHAIARLCNLTTSAVQTLERNLTCGEAGPEIRSALGILDNVKAMLQDDLEARLRALEERAEQFAKLEKRS